MQCKHISQMAISTPYMHACMQLPDICSHACMYSITYIVFKSSLHKYFVIVDIMYIFCFFSSIFDGSLTRKSFLHFKSIKTLFNGFKFSIKATILCDTASLFHTVQSPLMIRFVTMII